MLKMSGTSQGSLVVLGGVSDCKLALKFQKQLFHVIALYCSYTYLIETNECSANKVPNIYSVYLKI